MPVTVSSRSGSATLLVLGVLLGCAALVTSGQAWLRNQSTAVRLHANQVETRAAAVLGLREGMQHLSEDSVPSYDDLREPWAEPLRFQSSSGVDVQVSIRDAHRQWNLNHLSLPVSTSLIRTPEDMMADLFTLLEIRDREEEIADLTRLLRKEELPLQHVSQLLSLQPEWGGALLKLAPHVTALPRPENRFLPLNLNTVQPEVLSATVGPQYQGWVRTVLTQREAAPIASVDAVIRGLPEIARTALTAVVDVRSEYFEIEVRTEQDAVPQTLRALVRRPSAGVVEIVQCQW